MLGQLTQKLKNAEMPSERERTSWTSIKVESLLSCGIVGSSYGQSFLAIIKPRMSEAIMKAGVRDSLMSRRK
jgi:hypothetical protein